MFRSGLAGLGHGVSGLGDVIDSQLANICSTYYDTYSPIVIVSGCENAILYRTVGDGVEGCRVTAGMADNTTY